MTRSHSKRVGGTSSFGVNEALSSGYFRIRDFEYVQPLYDLAFLLEVDALAKGREVPKYRTFSLWRAGYSLDGYGTTIDRWLDGTAHNDDLDYVPSLRIRQYLTEIRLTGTIPELQSYRSEQFDRCLRLRSVRGLGPRAIALTVSSDSLGDDWLVKAALNFSLNQERITELYQGSNVGPWQTAHIVPPLLRFLNSVQECHGKTIAWEISGVDDPFVPVTSLLCVNASIEPESLTSSVDIALRRESLFVRDTRRHANSIGIKHQMGWTFVLQSNPLTQPSRSIPELTQSLDPLAPQSSRSLLSDLHLHTAWSDGSASVNTMATAAVASGLKYFAVTDHSRTSKLQRGLTPPLWLRQANALTLATPVCPVLHGIEVDILKDGTLDLPHSLLAAADLVVASVHSSWTDNVRLNTDRLLNAIESGCIDVIAHPTSAIIGKPGVPDYFRAPAHVHWSEVFDKCAHWQVAVELNCFPSRLDLPPDLLRQAVEAGCAVSIGSDAHARSHLLNLGFGEEALRRIKAPVVLNRFTRGELKRWIRASRKKRSGLIKNSVPHEQTGFQFRDDGPLGRLLLHARIQPPQNIPAGTRVIGIDLTAGDKATGLAVLDDSSVETCSVFSDDEILAYVKKHKPKIVSIDSPLGLPGGGDSIDPKAGIMRVAEYDLVSVGIPAYPSLIDSMKKLMLRGIRLRRAIEQFPRSPRVIESYPGAAQDILCIARKQKSLDLLREGLRRLGLKGPGLQTGSHDEMDAITSAIVGRYFEAGLFEPMGIPSEAQLIVPKVRPLLFDANPVICLAGKTGAGKSVVARYLSVFYGFRWIRTRDIIRQLLVEDAKQPPENRLSTLAVDPDAISEMDLRKFGAIVLDLHKQVPLRRMLTKTIRNTKEPVIVDSIRDTADVDSTAIGEKPVLSWFIDCDDAVIQHRLATKAKLGDKRISIPSPVDHRALTIRRGADDVISNNGSLEELRWRIDDMLFSITVLQSGTSLGVG